MDRLEELKKEYWKVLAQTRQSGRISSSVKEKAEQGWSVFAEDIIAEALRIHISRYPNYKESYTKGIMKNLSRQKEKTGRIGNTNKFHDFQQNNYDFDELEKALVSN